MSRQITTTTKIGQKCASVGEPLYVIAGMVRIPYIKMSRYCSGLDPITHKHLIQLSDFFDCEPQDLWGLVDEPLATDVQE